MQPLQTAEPRRTAGLLVDALGAALDAVTAQLQVHCLVEAEDGSVVGHSLRDEDAPLPLVTAVLRRTVAPLTSTLHRRRSVGLLPGGPLLSATLPSWDGVAQSAPLLRGGQRIGWLWLLGAADVTIDAIAAAARDVAAACPTGGEDDQQAVLRAALDGGRALPPELVAGVQRAWVVSIIGGRPNDVRLALAAAGRRRPPVHAVSYGDRVRLVHLDRTALDAPTVEAELKCTVAQISEALGVQLTAGMSEPADAAAPLQAAVRQADATCAAASIGECAALRDVRAKVVLELARAALQDLPDLGPDPVELLRDHDARRGTDLTRSVRCWLDAGGDVAVAAARMTVHPNTLRYRLRCAQAVAGVSFEDVSVRLELHLRLDG